MIAIIDNDVILKLARWDLHGELNGLLAACGPVYHLPTCVYALCGSASRMRKTGCDEESAQRIRAFCAATAPLPPSRDVQALTALAGIPGIDVGEVQIFAAASADPQALTYMGDKRSLLAIASAPSVGVLKAMLAGRVKCLEQVMGELMLGTSHAAIGAKVHQAGRGVDITMTIAFFGAGALRPERETWEALESYYGDLQHRTGDLLAPFPSRP